MFVYQEQFRDSKNKLFTTYYVMDGNVTTKKAYKMAKTVFKEFHKYGWAVDFNTPMEYLRMFSLRYIWKELAKSIKAGAIRNVSFKSDGSLMEKRGVVDYDKLVIVK